MVKHQVTREEVMENLMTDSFFDKKHFGLFLRQSIITTLSWIGVVTPFVWLAIPFLFPNFARKVHFRIYLEGLFTFDFLGIFLIVSFLIIVMLYAALTVVNNRRFKKSLKMEILHNTEEVRTRKALIEEFYTERFGPKNYRESVRYYSVMEQQNLDTGTIQKLFKEQGEEND